MMEVPAMGRLLFNLSINNIIPFDMIIMNTGTEKSRNLSPKGYLPNEEANKDIRTGNINMINTSFLRGKNDTQPQMNVSNARPGKCKPTPA
jgi:hypothetical protein